MDLTNEFRVAIPIERAWTVLTDLELIAPCMPGAQLQEVEGDVFRGVVKVKVGPVQAAYKGEVTFVDLDEVEHVAVLRAEGRETRGQGNASATISVALVPEGDGTSVSIVTDLTITGRVAQFGRGVLADVSAGLLDQFVANLEEKVLSGEVDEPTPEVQEVEEPPEAVESEADPATANGKSAERAPVPTPEPTPVKRVIDSPEAEPVDLMATAGTPVVKRLVPVIVVVVVGILVVRFLKKRRQCEDS